MAGWSAWGSLRAAASLCCPTWRRSTKRAWRGTSRNYGLASWRLPRYPARSWRGSTARSAASCRTATPGRAGRRSASSRGRRRPKSSIDSWRASSRSTRVSRAPRTSLHSSGRLGGRLDDRFVRLGDARRQREPFAFDVDAHHRREELIARRAGARNARARLGTARRRHARRHCDLRIHLRLLLPLLRNDAPRESKARGQHPWQSRHGVPPFGPILPSVDLHAGVLHQLRPLGDIFAHEFSELV